MRSCPENARQDNTFIKLLRKKDFAELEEILKYCNRVKFGAELVFENTVHIFLFRSQYENLEARSPCRL